MFNYYETAILDALNHEDWEEVKRLADEAQEQQEKLDAEERRQSAAIEDHQLGIYDSLPPEM